MNSDWGSVETEPEVDAWLFGLGDPAFGTVEYHIDLLARFGVLLGEPDTRQLRGKLRELRFYLGRERVRISYYVASGRRLILLTVFRKTTRRERAEVERAYEAMLRCIREGHTAED